MNAKVCKAIEEYARRFDAHERAVVEEKAACLHTVFTREQYQEAWRFLKTILPATTTKCAYMLSDGRVLILGGSGDYPEPMKLEDDK